MKEVFADTFFWTAIANPRDRWHDQAVAFRDSAADTTLVTTDEVLVELAANLAAADPKMRAFVADFIEIILRDRASVSSRRAGSRFLKVCSSIATVQTKLQSDRLYFDASDADPEYC